MKKHLMLLCTTLLSIQVTYAMDLNEALTSAYKTNENLKIAQQKFLQSAENFPQALAKFLPDISIGITSQKSKNTTVGQYAGNPASPTSAGPDVSRTLQVKQNIFNGGQDAYGLKIAQEMFMQSKATFYSAEQKVITDSITAYLTLCSSKEKYKIAEVAVESAVQNMNMAKEKLKVGEATIIEVAAAEAKFAKAQSDASQQLSGLIGAKANFRVLIGVEAPDDISFPAPPEQGIPDNIEALRLKVEKSNFDIIAAKSVLSQASDSVKQKQGVLLPNASLSLSQANNYFGPEGSPNPPNPSSRQNDRVVSATVSVTIPIFSAGGAAYSQIRQSKTQSRQAVYGLDSTKKQVHAYVITYWENFYSLKDVLRSNEEAVRAQTLTVDGMKSGYEVGTQTILDVLTQQDQLNQYKSDAVDIRAKYLLSIYQLKSLMGQLTAKQMQLKVKYFDPDYEFRNVKHKIVGF